MFDHALILGFGLACACVAPPLLIRKAAGREMESGRKEKSAVILWKIAKQLFETYVEFPWQPDRNRRIEWKRGRGREREQDEN